MRYKINNVVLEKPVIVRNEDGEEEEVKDFRRQKVLEDQEPDPEFVDLLAHKFMTEAERERIEQRERELYEAKMKVRRANDQRYPRDIKATKTTQLRAIAVAPKVEKRAGDLWQMSKFTSKAKPRLQTFRNHPANPSEGRAVTSPTRASKPGSAAREDFTGGYSDALRVDSPHDYVIYDGARAQDSDVAGAENIGANQEGDGTQAVIPEQLDPEQ